MNSTHGAFRKGEKSLCIPPSQCAMMQMNKF
jgi:hypothetical protein